MKDFEITFWILAFLAWMVSVIVFWKTLNFGEGVLGTVAFILGALAIWTLYKKKADPIILDFRGKK